MAAAENVLQLPQSHNSLTPRHGVVTLFGYGIQVRVDRGHLILQDGIGADRRYGRFPRVGHGLRRLVVIGADGMVSLAALRWLADQDAAFVMLERDGNVLATTGPVRRLHAGGLLEGSRSGCGRMSINRVTSAAIPIGPGSTSSTSTTSAH